MGIEDTGPGSSLILALICFAVLGRKFSLLWTTVPPFINKVNSENAFPMNPENNRH